MRPDGSPAFGATKETFGAAPAAARREFPVPCGAGRFLVEVGAGSAPLHVLLVRFFPCAQQRADDQRLAPQPAGTATPETVNVLGRCGVPNGDREARKGLVVPVSLPAFMKQSCPKPGTAARRGWFSHWL